MNAKQPLMRKEIIPRLRLNTSPRSQTLIQPGTKLLGPELLRFISAFAVLIWHYQHFYYIADHATNYIASAQPFYAILSPFYNYGYFGVQAFWCISGFIFFCKYRDSVYNGLITGRVFFILRFSRLYPLHFATLLLVALLQHIYVQMHPYFFVYQHNDAASFILQLFMASSWIVDNAYANIYSFDGPVWSVSLEVLVYFLFFIILRLIGKSWLTMMAMLALCASAKIFHFSNLFFECLAFFYMGGAAAIFSESVADFRFKSAVTVLAAGIALSAPACVWLLTLNANRYFYVVFPMAYLPLILFVLSRDFPVTHAIRKCIEAAGNMTYSSYLIHFPLQLAIAVACSILEVPIPAASPGFFSVFMCITLMASYCIYRYFEAPAQHMLRRKMLPRTHPARVAESVSGI